MDNPFECQSCHIIWKNTHALNTHQAMNKKCNWIRSFEKSSADVAALDALKITHQEDDGDEDEDEEEEEDDMNDNGAFGGQPHVDNDAAADADDGTDDRDPGEVMREFEEDNNLYHFVDVEPEPGLGEAGPGPATLEARRKGRILGGLSRALDDARDPLVTVEHPTAGRIIRMDATLHEKWNRLFGQDRDGDADMDAGASDEHDNQLYAPFHSELDWKVAQWAVKDGIGHKSFDRFLSIPGVKERLGLSFHNIRGIHDIVDKQIPSRAGKWHSKRFRFSDRPDEPFVVRYRSVIDGIRSLWGEPSLAEHLVYKPKQMFADEKKQNRCYSEMWTGKWWQFIQDQLDKIKPGATVASVILATDKTQLTQFSGSKSAYPVYLTLGNIPRALRRKPSQQACILLAYLPVDKIIKTGLTKREHSARYQRLFHESMKLILSPLKAAGREGIKLTGGDGAVRRVHPIISAYVADFPEQCLVTCSKGGTCAKCQVPADALEDPDPWEKRTQTWTIGIMNDAWAKSKSVPQYFKYCMKREVSGYVYEPFWKDFPFTDLHLSMTPDILHQLYQGVLRHLIEWCETLLTPTELDRRIRLLPPGLGLRHFKNGWSALSQVSGTERKNMAKILLGCLVGTSMPREGLTACRALLDFIYTAQYPSHNEETLAFLELSLKTFHDHKQYFVTVNLREDFNIPKFHAMNHYVEMIRLFGTTDNYNTEMFERLHIDFAKKGWRASNKRDEFPQMTKWLKRQENVASFGRYVEWAKSIKAKDGLPPPAVPAQASTSPSLLIPKHPTAPNKSLDAIAQTHKIPQFALHMKEYLNVYQDTPLSHAQYYGLPFNGLDVFHSFKFKQEIFDDDGAVRLDNVKAMPTSKRNPEGRFDTVVVLTGDAAESIGVQGTRIGQVKLIFRLPAEMKTGGLLVKAPSRWPKTPLAYIEWFTAPTITPNEEASHNMYTLRKFMHPNNGPRKHSIIPLTNIRQSCMLYPHFKKSTTDQSLWKRENVLEKADVRFPDVIEVRPQQLAIGDKTRADHLLVLEPFARLEKNELPLNRPYWSDPSGFLESLRECNEAKDPMKLEHGNLPRMVLVVIEEKKPHIVQFNAWKGDYWEKTLPEFDESSYDSDSDDSYSKDPDFKDDSDSKDSNSNHSNSNESIANGSDSNGSDSNESISNGSDSNGPDSNESISNGSDSNETDDSTKEDQIKQALNVKRIVSQLKKYSWDANCEFVMVTDYLNSIVIKVVKYGVYKAELTNKIRSVKPAISDKAEDQALVHVLSRDLNQPKFYLIAYSLLRMQQIGAIKMSA